jgi:hypothetical protein
MKLTIIVPDNTVTIDGRSIINADLSSLPTSLRVVQWSGAAGEEEHFEVGNVTGRVYPYNVPIASITPYEAIINAALAIMDEQDNPPPPPPPTSEELLAAANAAKERALANLTVTVDGMTLKADSEARQNMADAVRAAETLRALPAEQAAAALGLTVEQVAQYGGVETLTAAKPWKLADKTTAIVTLEQLKLASALAIVAVGNLVVP